MTTKQELNSLKIYNPRQIFSWVQWFHQYIGLGAQLQDVISTDRDLIFELYNTELFWIWIDLDSQVPFISLHKEKPVLAKKSKPMQLFLSSNAEGLRLSEVLWDKKIGRGMTFNFGEKDKKYCEVKINLIRGQPNVTALNNEKSISWNKPRDVSDLKYEPSNDFIVDFDAIAEGLLYLTYRNQKSAKSNLNGNDSSRHEQVKADIEKKIGKLQKTLTLQQSKFGQEKIEQIKILIDNFQSSVGVDAEIEKVILLPSHLKSFGQKLDYFFQQLKLEKSKIDLRQRKLEEVKNQIQSLQIQLNRLNSEASFDFRSLAQVKKNNLIKVPNGPQKKYKNVQYRTFELKTGLRAYMGKSALDNQNLIRQSQPWHLWIHLRDIPSAHVILATEKSQKITQAEIREASLWLLREHVKNKDNKSWPSVSVLVAECRYVTPVRSDKSGRVNYKNEKVFNFSSVSEA